MCSVTRWLNPEKNPAYFAKLAVSKKNNHILSLSEELLGEILGIKILCQPFLALVSCFGFCCVFFQGIVASKTDIVENSREKKPSVRIIYSALQLRS